MLRRLIVLALVAAAADGCTGRPKPGQGTEPVRLCASSQYTGTVDIFVLRETERYRMGSVTSFRTECWQIPAQLVRRAGSSLRLLADPVGSVDGVTVDVGALSPGAMLEWTIVDPLPLSTGTLRILN